MLWLRRREKTDFSHALTAHAKKDFLKIASCLGDPLTAEELVLGGALLLAVVLPSESASGSQSAMVKV